jgi:hypothetical protein
MVQPDHWLQPAGTAATIRMRCWPDGWFELPSGMPARSVMLIGDKLVHLTN